MYTRNPITVNQEQKSSKEPDLCEFLFGENMVMPLVNPLTTYYGDEEPVKQSYQDNGQNCNMK